MLSSEQLQALFVSITVQKSQVHSLLYLQQLCSDHKEETAFDTQLTERTKAENTLDKILFFCISH